jgi:hypothetical protein
MDCSSCASITARTCIKDTFHKLSRRNKIHLRVNKVPIGWAFRRWHEDDVVSFRFRNLLYLYLYLVSVVIVHAVVF